MNELDTFRRLAHTARKEAIPRIDVTARVLQTLHRREEPQGVNLALLVCSSLSVAAASILLVLAIDAWLPLADPVSDLVQLTMVMQ